ncbi:MAG TPA: M23 family metallopeptidase [Candidatus Faecimonas intestinavium]|nr:M23 family metallopeptidase [Bacilli bacterium]HIT23053.1 M23 family metallopeptidase [Candidatus Faecimonas intestinavium]
MKRRKLKPYVLPTIMTLAIVSVMFGTAMLRSNLQKDTSEDELTSYVTSTVLEEEQPVIKESTMMINPYTDTTVSIGKNYYDYKADAETQEKSIVYHDNTYMQNSGTDFVGEKVFDVVAVLDGSVTDVKEDETLGKVVEIKHENGYISIYQSLSEVSVKKGDMVTQGQVIGKSGTNELDKDMGNHLHFELYVNGTVVNPTLYLNKELQTSENKEQ